MFVELLCKSNFSFLRGASNSEDYAKQAVALGMPAIGISDINGVYGLPRAFEFVRDHAPELKLICGAEITIKDKPSIHLIARTRKGWALLCRIITQVHAGKEKGEGFITEDELKFLVKRFHDKNEITCILKNNLDNNFKFFENLFGKYTYLAVCRYLDGQDNKRIKQAIKIAEDFNLKLVATNDVHYHHPDKRFLQDCLVCIREGVTLDTAGFKLFRNEERYLKSNLQMKALFVDIPEAIENSQIIAQSCTFKLSELKYTYPEEAVPEGYTKSSYLEHLVFEGAKKKYRGLITYQIDAQIRKELNFFKKRGEEDYFLTMNDILKDAREKKIVFQGRGSAASSIVCYALGITAVEPISANLLFDRFANDARPDPPDIDVDFEHERREEVIQGIYSRYGRDRAAMVAAVHTYKSAGAYREICKAIGVDVGTLKADVIAAKFDELAGKYVDRKIHLKKLLSDIADSPRHIGTHSGGFVITNDPLIETVPVEPARMDGRTIVQFDKHDLETLGMMKMDILSIGFLTVIRKATEYLGKDWRDIPINDKKTYDLIAKAETAGCFQIESRAQMNSLPHTKPKTPYEMTIQVALIRPSMSKGGMSKSYLRGRRQASLGHPFKSGHVAMDKILGRTHGVSMFPDQIMQIAMDVCGFSTIEADKLRRSLGKERSANSVMHEGDKLNHALIKNGIREDLAKDILNRTQGFASYGFPEAHAASYGSLAFKSAYLKAHYPTEYLCALINSQPMGFYHIDFLINEAKRNSGVDVLPIHPNKSMWDATLEGPKTIRMGFRNVAKIRKEDVEDLVKERSTRSFDSIEDFVSRTDFDRAVLDHLALANAFDSFGLDRRHSFWKSVEFKNLIGKKKNSLQLSLFDEDTRLEDQAITFKSMTSLEAANIDYKVLGYSLDGSLMTHLRLEIPHLPHLNSKLIKKVKRNTTVTVAGILLVDQRPPPAKGFGFITLEDEFGTIDTVLRPDIYDKYKSVFRSSRFLICTGRIQRLDEATTLLVEAVESFAHDSKVRSHTPTPRILNRLSW